MREDRKEIPAIFKVYPKVLVMPFRKLININQSIRIPKQKQLISILLKRNIMNVLKTDSIRTV